MPTQITKSRIDRAIFQWEVWHNQRMTYSELARRADITLASLNRLMSGNTITPDLRKIDAIARVLECNSLELFETCQILESGEESKRFRLYAEDPRVTNKTEINEIRSHTRREVIMKLVGRFRNWRLIEKTEDDSEITLLRPGVNPKRAKTQDYQHLHDEFAVAWLEQNSASV